MSNELFGGHAGKSGRERGRDKLVLALQYCWVFGLIDATCMARIWRCTYLTAATSMRRFVHRGYFQAVEHGTLPKHFYILTNDGAAEAAGVIDTRLLEAGPPATCPSRVTKRKRHDLLSLHLALEMRSILDYTGPVQIESDRILRQRGYRIGDKRHGGVPDVLITIDDGGQPFTFAGELQLESESCSDVERRLSWYADSDIEEVAVGSVFPGVLASYGRFESVQKHIYRPQQKRWVALAGEQNSLLTHDLQLLDLSKLRPDYFPATSAVSVG